MVWKGDGESVLDLPTLRVGPHNVTLWRLSPEELTEVAETGCIMLDVLCIVGLPPVFVGSITSVKDLVFGEVQSSAIHIEDVEKVQEGSPLQTGGVPAPEENNPPVEVRDVDAQPGGSEHQQNPPQEIPR